MIRKIIKIDEEKCNGCGLCVKMLPEYYEMNNNKAIVMKAPEGKEALQAIQESIKKGPSKAIILIKGDRLS